MIFQKSPDNYIDTEGYDRSVINWAIYENESDEHSKQLFKDACRKHGCAPKFVHSDNGNPMKGVTLVGFFYQLGIVPSYSRRRPATPLTKIPQLDSSEILHGTDVDVTLFSSPLKKQNRLS